MIPIFRARRVKGARLLRFQNEEKFRTYLESIKAGTLVDVFVRKAAKPRSLPQNRYYWGVVIDMLSKHLGYDPETMHDSLKNKFLSFTDAASGLTIIRSTTTLNVSEFRQYCDEIQRWAAEWLEFYIPDPDQAIDWSDNEFYE